jgi:hypothetical protein
MYPQPIRFSKVVRRKFLEKRRPLHGLRDSDPFIQQPNQVQKMHRKFHYYQPGSHKTRSGPSASEFHFHRAHAQQIDKGAPQAPIDPTS